MDATPLAVIVAHGQPSDPAPLDAAVKALAARVSRFVPGWTVVGASLALPGSLEAALRRTDAEGAVIYPFFMSAGWFVKHQLRRRVAEVTGGPIRYLTPFGLDGGVPALCARAAIDGLGRCGHAPELSTLVLAAHGSRRGHAAARAAYSVAKRIGGLATFKDIRVGFVEEAPGIAEAAAGLAGSPAVCLPLFATRAGHVLNDVPDELDKAGFEGNLLPPIGEHPDVEAMIGRAIVAASRSEVSVT